VEGDIEACFDRIDHVALMGRVRDRIEDKRVLLLIKAFLKAGVLRQHGGLDRSVTGTPQGGILSPLLANIALSALDEHFARAWKAMGTVSQRYYARKRGEATYRLVRYADLCGCPHRSAYAERRVMPSGGWDAVWLLELAADSSA